MRFKLISCEILYREVCSVVARSSNQVDIQFLPKGLHDIGSPLMLDQIQAALNTVTESDYQAILIGYGLCGMGLAGLTARTKPVVVPRAHDCIALFLGSARRYLDYFHSHPGVYFKTTGWMERGEGLQPLSHKELKRQGLGYTYEELVEKYGEDNAAYLHQQLGNTVRNYGQLTFIETGVEPDDRFARGAREEAERRQWKFEKIAGDLSLLQRLVDGRWSPDEFLIVPPGWRVVATYDDSIIGAHRPR